MAITQRRRVITFGPQEHDSSGPHLSGFHGGFDNVLNERNDNPASITRNIWYLSIRNTDENVSSEEKKIIVI